MNNGRDCPHGRQVGKCDTCDLITTELELEKVTAERDALAAQVDGLTKVNSKLSQLQNQQGRINQLEAALDCLQFAAHLNKGQCENLDRVLAETLVIHNNAPEEMPSSCLAEIRALAGRDGFIAGYFHYKNYGFQFEEELEEAAKQYANIIRQEVK